MKRSSPWWSYAAVVAAVVLGIALLLEHLEGRRRLERLEAAAHATLPAPAETAAAEAPPQLPAQPLGVAAAAAVPAAAPPAAPGPAAEERGGEAAASPRTPPSADDQVAYADLAYSQQTFDAGWARDAEAGLGAGLQRLLGTSSLRGLECRQTLCRARLDHEDAAHLTEFIDRLIAEHDLWTGAITSYRESAADGAVRTVLYFAREGTEIPRLR